MAKRLKTSTTKSTSKLSKETETSMPTQLIRWEKERQVGRTKYIIKSGLIKWSLLAYGLYVLMMLATYKFQVTPQLILSMLPYLGLFAILGVLYGLLSWHLAEKNYNNYISKQNNQ